jgi:hypothetical protein
VLDDGDLSLHDGPGKPVCGVLERMNMVGMAVQILDAIPEAESELKNKTRAEMVSLVL